MVIVFLYIYRQYILFMLTLLAATCLMSSVLDSGVSYADAGINQELSFQGKVVSNTGENIPDGTYNMEFKIYSGGTNTGGGTLDWTEDWLISANNGVKFTSGTFGVNLGAITPFGNSINWNSQPLYLSLQVGGTSSCTPAGDFTDNCAGDDEMLPYIPITSVPSAMDANELNGLASSAFGQLANNQTWTGNNTIQDNSASALLVQNTTGGVGLEVDTNDSWVGIGATPTNRLTVAWNSGDNGATAVFGSADSADNQIAVYAESDSQDGVQGISVSKYGVEGDSTTSDGILGSSSSGVGVEGESAEGISGEFQSDNQSNTQPTLVTMQNGTGTADLFDAQATPIDTLFSIASTGATQINPDSGVVTALSINAQPTPTIDTTTINTQSVTTAHVNALDINYSGGNAAVSSSAFRVDYAPGTASGGTWDGMHVVANPLGAATGVVSNGLELDGPTSDNGGTNEAINIGTGWDIGLDINSGGLQLADMGTPATPTEGELKVYAASVDGRSMLKELSPNGVSYAIQPSLFQQNVVLVTGGNGTSNSTYTTIGSNVTASGTLSTTAGSSSEALGNTSRIATGATANTTSGFYTKNVYYLGSLTNGADGFFYFARMNLNGQSLTNYENATTGSRIFMGMCGSTFTACDSSDAPASSNAAGFQLSGSRGDTTFQFLTCNGSACSDVNTGVAVTNSDTYDFYVYTPPQGTTVYWRIDDLTTGTTPVTGTTTTDLPTGTAAMNAGLLIDNLSAANRYIYFQRMYFETDR